MAKKVMDTKDLLCKDTRDMCEDEVVLRLSKIEGQIRGITAMVKDGRTCDSLLMQISSANSALTNVARLIMELHIEHCVTNGFKSGDEYETTQSLKQALASFAKLK